MVAPAIKGRVRDFENVTEEEVFSLKEKSLCHILIGPFLN